MKITATVKDINGVDINEGDRVCAYEQRYAELSRDDSGPVLVVVVDGDRPLPVKDVPLFIGRVRWDDELLSVQIDIENMMVDWSPAPCSVRMGGGNYAYEVVRS